MVQKGVSLTKPGHIIPMFDNTVSFVWRIGKRTKKLANSKTLN